MAPLACPAADVLPPALLVAFSPSLSSFVLRRSRAEVSTVECGTFMGIVEDAISFLSENLETLQQHCHK